MITALKNLLCKIGIHDWETIYRKSRCEYYPLPILVSKTCKRCNFVKYKEGVTDHEE